MCISPLRNALFASLSFFFITCSAQQCEFQVIAGPPSTSAGDGGNATSAWLSNPTGLAVDVSGNVYIADTRNNKIRVVGADGKIHTFLGTGTQGSDGDGGKATAASLNLPQAVMAAPDGTLYIADTGNHRIRRVMPDGTITAFIGTGHPGFDGDGGLAINAELNGPQGMALGPNGSFYFADTGNNRIRKVDTSGNIATVAGADHPNSTTYFGGDGGLAANALLYLPGGLAFAQDGTLLIADTGNGLLRHVSMNGIISTIASGPQDSLTYPVPATTGHLGSFTNFAIQLDGSIVIPGFHLLRLTADWSTLEIYAPGIVGMSVGQDSRGRVYVTGPPGDDVILRLPEAGAAMAIFAGKLYYGKGTEGGSALGATLHFPVGMTVAADGTVYVADRGNQRIAKITPDGTIRTLATINDPTRVAGDSSSNVFVSDMSARLIRKITPTGVVETYAGNFPGGNSLPLVGQPPVPATSVSLMYPYGLAVDSNDNLYGVTVSTQGLGVVVRIASDGTLTTFWNPKPPGAPSVFSRYFGLAIDSQQDVLAGIGLAVGKLAKVTPAGTSVAVAGPQSVSDIAAGPSGKLFVIDSSSRIKQLSEDQYPSIYNADLSAFLGSSVSDALIAGNSIADPMSIATDRSGNLYISDHFLHRIRKLVAGSCTPLPSPVVTSIVSAATFTGTTFAPGELVTIQGAALGPTTGVGPILDDAGFVPNNVGGVSVLFEGTPGRILYASATQINAIIPFTAYGRTSVRVQVKYNCATSDATPISMASTAPGLFLWFDPSVNQSVPIVVNQDGSLNSGAHPAPAGSYITLYATGLGRTSPEGIDGHLATLPLPAPKLPVTTSFGTLLYAGDAFNLVEGASQINIQLPNSPAPSSGNITLIVGGASTKFSIYIK